MVSRAIHCEEALLEMDETEGQADLKHEQEEELYEVEEGQLTNLLHHLWQVEQAQVSQVEQEQAREVWEDAPKVWEELAPMALQAYSELEKAQTGYVTWEQQAVEQD